MRIVIADNLNIENMLKNAKDILPATGVIDLESTEKDWVKLADNLVSEIRFTGLVKKEADRKVRIKLRITKIFPPDKFKTKTSFSFGENSKNTKMTDCVIKAIDLVMNKVAKKWIMLGETEGKNNPRPIALVYFPSLGITTYSVQTQGKETKEEVLKEAIDRFVDEIKNRDFRPTAEA